MTGIPGTPPDLRNPPAGCPFHPRCRHVMERCRTELPPLRQAAPAGAGHPRVAACWLQDGSAPPPAELARPEPAPGPDPRPAAGTNSPAAGTSSPAAGPGDATADAEEGAA
jgi:hypothetical protein